MAYYGIQGVYTNHPRYLHRDGSITHERPDSIIAYHDECAHKAFGVDTTREGYGRWHHGSGLVWSPGNYSSNNHPCEGCGEAC